MDFFDYFQISVFLFLQLLYAIRIIQLKRNGINIFVFGVGKNGLHAFIEYIIYLGYFLWTLMVVLTAIKFEPNIFPDIRFIKIITGYFFDSKYLRIIGTILVFLAGVGIAISTITLKDAWKLGIDKGSNCSLVNSGIYTLSRNPIYFFYEIYLLGTWLIYSNINFLVTFIIAITILHLQILQEEKFLLKKYGNQYIYYMKMVRRYI